MFYAFIFHIFLSDILSSASHVLFLEISNLRKPEIIQFSNVFYDNEEVKEATY